MSPLDDVSGALEEGMEEAPPDVTSEVCIYIRKLLTLANDHKILKGASFSVTPDTNALCQRMANKVHRDDIVLPGDRHVTAMEALKDEFGLRTSPTTTPGLSAQNNVCSHNLSEDTNATKAARAGTCPWAAAEIESTTISQYRDDDGKMPRMLM